jgi:hypothetical protein
MERLQAVIAWAKSHPVVAGGIVLAVVVIVFFVARSSGGSGEPSDSITPLEGEGGGVGGGGEEDMIGDLLSLPVYPGGLVEQPTQGLGPTGLTTPTPTGVRRDIGAQLVTAAREAGSFTPTSGVGSPGYVWGSVPGGTSAADYSRGKAIADAQRAAVLGIGKSAPTTKTAAPTTRYATPLVKITG